LSMGAFIGQDDQRCSGSSAERWAADKRDAAGLFLHSLQKHSLARVITACLHIRISSGVITIPRILCPRSVAIRPYIKLKCAMFGFSETVACALFYAVLVHACQGLLSNGGPTAQGPVLFP